jgi:hypothetical protein
LGAVSITFGTAVDFHVRVLAEKFTKCEENDVDWGSSGVLVLDSLEMMLFSGEQPLNLFLEVVFRAAHYRS